MRRWAQLLAVFLVVVAAVPSVQAREGRFWRFWRLFRLRGKMSEVNNNPSDQSFGRQDGLSWSHKQTWPGEYRHDARLSDQANDPAGGNVFFARPMAQDQQDTARGLFRRQMVTAQQKARQDQLKQQLQSQNNKEQQARDQRHKEQNRNIFQRFRAAWKARWQNRAVKADKQSPFENNGGFGETTQRAVLPINSRFVFRTDLNKRIPKPKPFRPPPRRPATPTF